MAVDSTAGDLSKLAPLTREDPARDPGRFMAFNAIINTAPSKQVYCDFPAEDCLPYGKGTGHNREDCDVETLEGMIVKLEKLISGVKGDRFHVILDSLTCAQQELRNRKKMVGGIRVQI